MYTQVPRKNQQAQFTNKSHKIKLYGGVLTKLVEIKPEFVLGMGRLIEDMMPPVRLMLSKENESLDILETKMLHAMKDFMIACN